MPTVLGRNAATGQVKLRVSDGSVAFAKWHGNAEPAVGSSVEYNSKLGTATSKAALYGGQVPQPLRPEVRSSFNLAKDKNDVDYVNGSIWDIDETKKKAKFSLYHRTYGGAKWYAKDPTGAEVLLTDSTPQPLPPAEEVAWRPSFASTDLVVKTKWEDSFAEGGTSVSGQTSIIALRVADKRTVFSTALLKGNVETVNNGFDGIAIGVLRSAGAPLMQIEEALQAVLSSAFNLTAFPEVGHIGDMFGIPFELTYRFLTFEATGLPFGMKEYEYELDAEQLPVVEPGECFVVCTATVDEQYHVNGYWSVEDILYS